MTRSAEFPGLGSELLLGLRWTEEFGTVLTIGPGRVYAEFLAWTFLKDDPQIEVFAVYMEGFRVLSAARLRGAQANQAVAATTAR